MKTENLPVIPTPPAQRLRHARATLLPAVVFVAGLLAVAGLWRNHVGAPTLIGLADGPLAHVSSQKSGVLANLNVTRFQQVRAGDTLGQVMVAEPRILEASLAVIRADLDMLRANLQPIVAQQRNAVDYAQLRLDWMRQRADLAAARVNLQLAESEFHRTEELFKEKIASDSALDIARANFHAQEKHVEELILLVTEGEQSFKNLQPVDGNDISRISDAPMRAAIAVQEAKLRLTEAELSPITLRAPIDGKVSVILHRSGEAVTPGQPILAIAGDKPARIVAYLRRQQGIEPQVGNTVQVRTRRTPREMGLAQVVGVGAQLEALPPALQTAIKFFGTETALPVDISLPANFNLHPGEIVDIKLVLAGK
ncbi:MAG: HlyD family efflux transporter periplasmic adaptor subunit [Verrucomicrobia bacterium]|nr:MAG: HlyD family efflux transporter periplasmic adaptor subunit [Verrucomicrobiota bacterium]